MIIDKFLDFGSRLESVGAFPTVLGGTDQPLTIPKSMGAGRPLYLNIMNVAIGTPPVTGPIRFLLKTAATAAGIAAGNVLLDTGTLVVEDDTKGAGLVPGLIYSSPLPAFPPNVEALGLEISAETIVGGTMTFEAWIGEIPQTADDDWGA